MSKIRRLFSYIMIEFLFFFKKNKVFFYCVYVLLFAGAKAWGYTAADKGYLLIAAAGSFFWFLAIIGSSYTKKELIVCFALLSIGALSLISSHKLGAIFPAMALVAAKDVSIDKVISIVAKFWAPIMVIRIFGSIIGIIPMVVDYKRAYINSGRTVYGMGYCTGNCFYTVLVVAILLLIYSYWNNVKIWWSVIIVLISVIAYQPSLSTTGMFILFVIAMFIICSKLIKRFNSFVAQKVLNIILLIFITVPYFFTFILWGIYGHNEAIDYILERLTNNRIWVNYEMGKVYSITLFGQEFVGQFTYEMIDNAYFYTFLGLGIVSFILYSFLFGICIYRVYRVGDTRRLFILSIFFLYGFMEQFFINPFMNFSMLFICDIIWDNSNKKLVVVKDETVD